MLHVIKYTLAVIALFLGFNSCNTNDIVPDNDPIQKPLQLDSLKFYHQSGTLISNYSIEYKDSSHIKRINSFNVSYPNLGEIKLSYLNSGSNFTFLVKKEENKSNQV